MIKTFFNRLTQQKKKMVKAQGLGPEAVAELKLKENNVPALREMCRSLNIDDKGKKQELIDRLLPYSLDSVGDISAQTAARLEGLNDRDENYPEILPASEQANGSLSDS